MSLKASAARPPEFFLDRCLGRTVARRLADTGWTVYRVGDVFPNDAQTTPDEEWIAYGLRKGWALLTQDKHIRYRAHELAALADGRGVMFQLSSGNLTILQKTGYFESNRSAIFRAAPGIEAALYTVYADRIAKSWP